MVFTAILLWAYRLFLRVGLIHFNLRLPILLNFYEKVLAGALRSVISNYYSNLHFTNCFLHQFGGSVSSEKNKN